MVPARSQDEVHTRSAPSCPEREGEGGRGEREREGGEEGDRGAGHSGWVGIVL